MTRNPRMLLLAIAAGGLLAAPALAWAQYGKLDPGLYTIQVDWTHIGAKPAAGYCLIHGNNGNGGPERFLWNMPQGDIGWCQFQTRQQLLDNGQAVYRLNDAGFFGQQGERAYVIVNQRSGECLHYDRATGDVYFTARGCDPIHGSNSSIWLVTGSWTVTESPLKPFLNPTACLIFSNNGYDRVPSVHRWPNASSDHQWCGLGSEASLRATGQGLFMVRRMIE